MKIKANRIQIEVEDSGADGSQAGRPVVLLIMGLGMQLVAWPPAFVQALLDAGFRVVRHDNRDIGHSQYFDHLGVPSIVWATIKLKLGLRPRAPYSLQDMADDARGVLDALGVAQAHVIGVSMGGMIAQRLAISAPDRCLSLTSIMSTSGARGLPQAKPEVIRALLSRPASRDREAILDHYVKLLRAIGSPAWPMEESVLRERIAIGVDRSFHPAGTLRQMLAVGADTGQRTRDLGRLRLPTLVLHGKADPLVPFACGEDTARRIPGAHLVGIEGMGHDLPPQAVSQLLAHIVPFMQRGAVAI
jgi:pimeloyl-ACP methyl ester carboxylesterase